MKTYLTSVDDKCKMALAKKDIYAYFKYCCFRRQLLLAEGERDRHDVRYLIVKIYGDRTRKDRLKIIKKKNILW